MANLFIHKDPDAQREFEALNNPILQRERVISTVADGTAPLEVASSTVVDNLNADTVDGQHAAAFAPAANACKYYSVEFTVTAGGGDITITIPFDWTGGYLKVFRSDAANEWAENIQQFESSHDALTNAAYASDRVYAHTSGGHDDFDIGTDVTGVPNAATTTTIVFNDDGSNTRYLKIFVWA